MLAHRRRRHALARLLAVLGIAATLGGCIVVPAGPYRPYRYHYYY